jgi:hypothetical protein
LTAHRTVYYEPPGQNIASAALRYEQATTPVSVVVTPYTPGNGEDVPAVSSWGMILMTLLMLSAGTMISMRRPPLLA